MRLIGLWMMAALAWAVPGADWARAAEPVNIRIVWYVVPYGVTPLLFQLPDVMTHVGKSYTVEFVHLASGSSLPQALASGDVDLGPMSALPLAVAIENAGMSDIRLVSDEYQDGVAGYWSGRFVVLKDGPIKTVEDLKGKVVASLGIGSSGDMAVRFMLRKHGLEANRDYTSLEASAGTMPAMLVAGKVDLINTTGLTARDALVVAKTRVLFDRREVFGGPTQEGTFSARAGFLAKNRAAMVDYMEDYLRALRWFADPAHHDEAVQRLAAFTKAPASQFDWFFTSGDEYRDPNGLPNLPALQKSIDVLADFGLIKPGLDIAKYADLSIVQEAAARLQSAPKP